MPLPARVQRQFKKVPSNPSEGDFHGPYNMLLSSLFPFDDFTVGSRYWPQSCDMEDSVYIFKVLFEEKVLLEDKTVFILEVNSPQDLALRSVREIADQKIRDCIGGVIGLSCLLRMMTVLDYIDCPLPTLHAISAMGTKLCFYNKSRNGPVTPHCIPPNLDPLLDVAPVERWDCDILEEDGAQKFQAVIEEIIKGCETL